MHRIVLTVLWIAALFSVKAQEYAPFIEDQKTWTIRHDTYTGIGGDHHVHYEVQSLFGDTLIDGIAYQVFKDKNQHSNTTILREDTASQQLIQFNQHSGIECLVFDFAAEQGDTIQTCLKSIVIDSVSEIQLLSGETRKICYTPNYHYVMGIGSSLGFVELDDYQDVDHTFHLMCVQSVDEFLYGNYCNSLGEGKEMNNHSILKVYPNPAQSFIMLSGNEKPKRVRILDTRGNVVFVESKRFQPISIHGLDAGFYLVEITTVSTVITEKLIKN